MVRQQVEQDRRLLKTDSLPPRHYAIFRWNAALPAYEDELLHFNTWLDQYLPDSIRAEGNFRYGIGLSTILERAWLLNS